MIRIFKKGEEERLGKYLFQHELDCKCEYDSCTTTLMHSNVIHSFNLMREFLKVPLHITSAYRCQMHNMYIEGSPTSNHKIGNALDLANPLEDIEEFEGFAKMFFDQVIVYKDENFLHCANLNLK